MQEPEIPLLDRARRVIEANSDSFVELIKVAQLDPNRELRFSNWSGISFKGLDLRSFDFTGSRLVDCDFAGARIKGARFEAADINGANLRKAKDWAAYAESWSPPKTPVGTRHLRTGAVFQDAPFAPEMVVLPQGEFMMGSPDGSGGDNGDQAEEGRCDDEGPRRRVAFDCPFAIGRFAVTVAEFRAFAAAKKSRGKAGQSRQRAKQDDRHPVTEVSWEDAVAYCAWLNARLGLPPNTYRLPSEAEWEYCARAGTDRPFWWEGPISTDKANYDGNYTYGNSPKGEYRQRTVPVDSFAPNPWGLYQVHGNVWEWTQDCYHDSYAGAPSDGSAWITGNSSRRVLRGGAWFVDPRYLGAAFRCGNSAGFRLNLGGFRLGRTPTP